MTYRWKTPLSALAALVLAACGGGGGGGIISTGAAPSGISGVVVDGYLEGATVFLDLNNNAVHDSGEPISKPTGTDGAYTLDTTGLSPAQIAQAFLVAIVPKTAKDSDFPGQTLEQRGKQGYTLVAPAEAYVDPAASKAAAVADAVLSPLTTLVASEMLGGGAQLEQARARVEERLQLQGRDLMQDFVANGDKAMHAVAQVAATALGEVERQVAAAAEASASPVAKEKLKTVLEVASQQVPALIRTLGVAPVAQAPMTPAPAGSAGSTGAASSSSASSSPSSGTDTAAASAAEVMARVKEELEKNQSAVKAAVGESLSKKSRYIVVFKSDVGNPKDESDKIVRGVGNSKREFLYENALKGFAVSLPEAAAEKFLEAMAKNPNVDYVETDREISLSTTTQSKATWGLDRIDQRDLPLSSSYTYDTTGTGVKAYVIDTGIQASHSDFGGRVISGYSAIFDGKGTDDCNGHGTHVAGTIAGTNWGVAKGATLVPVRVLDCVGSGTTSGVIAGIDWAASNANGTPSVINMSLGGGAYQPLDDAVAGAVAKGITVVVAAGNSNVDACTASPARAPAAITVGATTNTDARASFSNWGSCLDLFAPGNSITSAWLSNGTSTISGTSMAAPHVAGAVARLLQAQPTLKPADIDARIKADATPNKVTSAGTGSPNRLLMAVTSGSTITEPATPKETVSTVISVKGLSGSAANVKNGWRAQVAISVKDASGNPVQGAVVDGGFTAGGSTVSCTTASNGSCAVSTGTLSKRVTSTTYSVKALSGTGMSYDANQNAASSLTVRMP